VPFAIGVGHAGAALGRRSRVAGVAACAAVLAVFAALAHARVGDWRSSEALFEREAALAPGQEFARLKLAMVALDRGDLAAARAHAEEALARDAGSLLAFETLLDAATRQGDDAAIAAVLSRVDAARPDLRGWTAAARGERLLARGDLAGAERAVADGLAAAPEDPDLVRTAGHLEASRGRLDRAERAYRLAARRTRSAAPWLDLGNVLLG